MENFIAWALAFGGSLEFKCTRILCKRGSLNWIDSRAMFMFAFVARVIKAARSFSPFTLAGGFDSSLPSSLPPFSSLEPFASLAPLSPFSSLAPLSSLLAPLSSLSTPLEPVPSPFPPFRAFFFRPFREWVFFASCHPLLDSNHHLHHHHLYHHHHRLLHHLGRLHHR